MVKQQLQYTTIKINNTLLKFLQEISKRNCIKNYDLT